MAISKEDKKDVQKHMGKALANKVSKVTKDKEITLRKGKHQGCGVHNTNKIFNL